ncbi:hypothetical protein ACWC3X_42155 [Streptomyces populi]
MLRVLLGSAPAFSTARRVFEHLARLLLLVLRGHGGGFSAAGGAPVPYNERRQQHRDEKDAHH